jgi:hypothetical protein
MVCQVGDYLRPIEQVESSLPDQGGEKLLRPVGLGKVLHSLGIKHDDYLEPDN